MILHDLPYNLNICQPSPHVSGSLALLKSTRPCVYMYDVAFLPYTICLTLSLFLFFFPFFSLQFLHTVDIGQGDTGPKILAGSNLTLTCWFHDKRNHEYAVSDIVWYERPKGSSSYNVVPREQYEIIDNETISLHVTNLSKLGEHRYACLFEQIDVSDLYLGGHISIYVGSK